MYLRNKIPGTYVVPCTEASWLHPQPMQGKAKQQGRFVIRNMRNASSNQSSDYQIAVLGHPTVLTTTTRIFLRWTKAIFLLLPKVRLCNREDNKCLFVLVQAALLHPQTRQGQFVIQNMRNASSNQSSDYQIAVLGHPTVLTTTTRIFLWWTKAIVLLLLKVNLCNREEKKCLFVLVQAALLHPQTRQG